MRVVYGRRFGVSALEVSRVLRAWMAPRKSANFMHRNGWILLFAMLLSLVTAGEASPYFWWGAVLLIALLHHIEEKGSAILERRDKANSVEELQRTRQRVQDEVNRLELERMKRDINS